jgi:transcription initiation factor TFIIIB Brf1 subunit/transcription initiation factor TFIIB
MVLDDKSIHDDNESSAGVCPICKSNSVITDPESGEIVCSQCGLGSCSQTEIVISSAAFLSSHSSNNLTAIS